MSGPQPNPALIVPMDVAALLVGKNDVLGDASVSPRFGTIDFAKVAAEFHLLRRDSPAYRSDDVLAGPFESQSEALQPGIHLHYSLPDSLARGATDGTGNVAFRPVPNRFLVARIASRQNVAAAAARIAAWVVESDHVWTDEASRTADPRNKMSRAVPVQPKVNADLFHYQGRVSACGAWTEGSQSGGPHTALGYGAPDFAAAYSHAPNIFGFYDPIDDLGAGLGTDYPVADSRLSYLVVAWFSDPANDPVQLTARSLKKVSVGDSAYPGAFAAALKHDYGWSYAAQTVPDRTFCVGLLTDIAWDASKHYVYARPDNTPLHVAVGTTVAEALSAVMASQRPDLHGLETILNALQYGQLRQFEADAIDGLANLEDMLHQRGFTTFAAGDDRQSDARKIGTAKVNTAGVIYLVKRDSPADPAQRPGDIKADDLGDIAASAGQPLPADVAAALNKLNIAQAAFDDLCLEIRVRRNQIFADWYQYVSVTYVVNADDSQARPDPNGIAYYLNAEVANLARLTRVAGVTADDAVPTLTTLQKDRDAQLTALLALLDKSYFGQFLLRSVPAPRYYQAADPVVLLSGPDVAPSFRHGGDGRFNADKSLSCRLGASVGHAGDLLSAATIAAGTAGIPSAKTVAADALPGLPASPGLARDARLAGDLAALVADALFLDPNLAHQLAALAQSGNAGLVGAIQSAQKALADEPLKPSKPGSAVMFAGVAPSPVGCQRYSAPWIPLLLQWEAAFQPFRSLPADATAETYANDWVKSSFQLDPDDIETVYRPAPPDRNAKAQAYRGVIVLTHNAELDLKSQINDYLANYPADPNRANLANIRDKMDFAMMAQALSGFHRALVMRQQTLQMPVFLPRSPDPANTNTDVANAVADANDAVALPLNNYNPLRAGMLTLTRLRLVDAFGQHRDITGPGRGPIPLIRAASLSPAAQDDPRAVLPLRITQPARLSFRYLSADPGAGDNIVEMNSDPASSPIFGWILFNRLDDSLAIYDADGAPRGTFNEYGIFWQGVPGDNLAYEQPIAATFASANRHLRAFATAVHDRGKIFVSDLLKTLDNSAGRIAPATSGQDDALALLMSRPFALVRANLGLDLYGGLPAMSQSYAAMKQATDPFNDNADAPYPHNTAGADGRYAADFQHVRVPVRLGDNTRVNDGLVGYFVESDPNRPYDGTLWAAAAPKGAAGIAAPPSGGPIALATADAAPTTVTMIIDPRAPVHAFTGILPAKQIALPPAHYARALKRIAVTFLTTPVLGHAEQMALPLPQETAHDWSWLTAGPDGRGGRVWTEQKPIFAPNPRAAFADLPQQVAEGWLRLFPAPKTKPKNN